MAPPALALIVVGFLLASPASGFVKILGVVMTVSGLGALVALVPLAFGNRPDRG